MFTPLPPAWTGTADYAAALLPELEKLVKVEVFERVPRSFDPKAFDTVVYQIANNTYHSAFYEAALRHPGVVVLHEPNLHDLVKGKTLDAGNEAAYLREVVYEIFSHELCDVATDTALLQCPQPRTFSMSRRLLDKATGCIVHSGYAERAVRMKNYAGPLAVVPHGAAAIDADAAPFRAALGLPPGTPVVGIYGYQRPDKRTLECLQAFAALRRFVPNAHVIVVGQPHPDVDLQSSIRELGLEKHASLVGFQQSLADFDGYLAACDVVVNLRNPTFGETSGTMMRAFGLGKTVIVSDNGSNHDLPDDICLRLPDDEYEGRVLLECLKWLWAEPSRITQIGVRARQWAARECAWPGVAEMYASFLETIVRAETVPALGPPAPRAALFPAARDAVRYMERWIDPESDGAQYFNTHVQRLARTLQLTPPGTVQDRILEMGCYLQITPALQRVLGYGEVRGCHLGPAGGGHIARVAARDGEEFECRVDLFNAETQIFPYADEYFSTVVCGELLEHLEQDPVHMLSEVYRILKRGGMLLLTTPNIVSLRAVGAVLKGKHPASFSRYHRGQLSGAPAPGHAREYTPHEIRLLLSDCGFMVRHIETGPYGNEFYEDGEGIGELLAGLKFSTTLRGDCIFALGSKEPMPRTRFPTWLYGG